MKILIYTLTIPLIILWILALYEIANPKTIYRYIPYTEHAVVDTNILTH